MKERIIELLRETGREGIEDLIAYMDEYGFFRAPCSTSHHLAKEGGLAEHSYNVLCVAQDLSFLLCNGPENLDKETQDAITISALLHDLGKMGQYNKPNYVPNMLKGRATKANPNPEPYQSEKKPYISNPDLLYVDHEVRSVAIASRFIELTEEEQQAILWHNGLYGSFRYQIQGKETPLYMLLHFADMWASRVIENGGEDNGEIQDSQG